MPNTQTVPSSWGTRIAIAMSFIAFGSAAGIAEVQHSSNERADNNACTLKGALNKIADRTNQSKVGNVASKNEAVRFYRDLSGNLKPDIRKCKDSIK